MSRSRFSHPACHFAGSAADHTGPARAVCRHALPGGACAVRDLMTLHAMTAATADISPLSRPYFTDALMHFIARDCAGGGAISDSCARGITTFVTTDGAVNSSQGLDLMFYLLESDSEISESLPQVVLEQVALAICDNRGAYHDRRPANASGITNDDLRFINRVFKAIIKRDRHALLPEEYAILQRIDNEVPSCAQPSAWGELMALVRQVHDDPAPPAQATRPWLQLDDPWDERLRAHG